MHFGVKYWLQVFLLPIYWISFIVPRNKCIWLFGSTFGNRFADNPKYFYLYMQQNHKEIRTIWITKDKSIASNLMSQGYESYYYLSLKGIYYSMIGKIYFFDNYSKDINFYLSGGAIKYNFWHGIPLKKIQMDNKFDQVRHPKNFWMKLCCTLRRLTDEKPSHYVLTTANYLKPIFESAFDTKKVEINSYPRNEFIRTNTIDEVFMPGEKEIFDKIKKIKEVKKIAFYMPTFRKSEDKFSNIVSLEKLNKFLLDNSIYMIIKLHPKSNLKKRFETYKSENIYVIPAEYDPYPYLKESDLLITDYSSIYFDYLLLNKPIIFFDYDKVDYLSQSRELYFEYEDYTPGIKASNQKELENAMLLCYSLEDRWKPKRERIKDIVFEKFQQDELNQLYSRIRQIVGLEVQ